VKCPVESSCGRCRHSVHDLCAISSIRARNLVREEWRSIPIAGLTLGVPVATARFSPVVDTPRRAERRQVELPARLTWKDASGAVRFTSVTMRNVSEAGVFVDADCAASIPLHKLVHVQVEKTARGLEGLPAQLRDGRVLSAVWRVAPCLPSRGTPAGYALRFLVEPRETLSVRPADDRMAVAS
jgi:hypothetical protein